MPTKLSQFFKLFLLNLLFYQFYRIIFYIYYSASEIVPAADVAKATYLGLKFDIRFVCFFLAPIFLTLPFKKINLFSGGSKVRKSWLVYLGALHAVIFLLYLIDFYSYDYIQTRINNSLSKLLEDVSIAMTMIWQTYPVFPVLLLIAVNVYVYFKIVKKWILAPVVPIKVFKKSKLVLIGIFAFLLWGLGIYGKISKYPLRWSEGYFAASPFLSAYAQNPVLYLIETWKFQSDKTYTKEDAMPYLEDIAKYLGMPTPQEPQFVRERNPQKKIPGTPNVVIIVLESMAAYKSSLFNNPLKATPYMDQVGHEGILFKRFYVPTQATARSMFTTVTGLPDLSLVESGSRNPLIIDQHSILNDYKGYDRLYFLGGSANWGNIRGIFSYNIDGLEIHEEGSFNYPNNDVWGISDYHLLMEANNIFKSKDKPFVAVIQTAGFHRPYTIPEDHGTFQVLNESEKHVKNNGFKSVAEFNSLRFQDYALGNFLELAKKEKYFENTLFVIYGDHGIGAEKINNLSKGEVLHKLYNFQVPFILYMPKYLKPQEITTIVSQLDVQPTIAGLVGLPYKNTTMGRDLFSKDYNPKDPAFMYYWYTEPPEFSLIDDKFFYVATWQGRSSLYEYNSDHPEKDVKSLYPEIHQKLERHAKGFFITSRYLMMNNKK